MASSSKTTEDIRKEIHKKLLYLSKEQLLALSSSINSKPTNRLVLLPSLVLIKTDQYNKFEALTYLTYDPIEGQYQEKRKFNLAFATLVLLGPSDESLLCWDLNEVSVYDLKNGVVTPIIKMKNLRYLNCTIPGSYIIGDLNSCYKLKVKEDLTRTLTKISIPKDSHDVHELAFNTLLVELRESYKIIQNGDEIDEISKFGDIQIIRENFKLKPRSFIGWYKGEIDTIFSSQVKIEEFTVDKQRRFFDVATFPLSSNSVAVFGTENSHEDPVTNQVNIYVWKTRKAFDSDKKTKMKLVQVIEDIEGPTRLNDHHFLAPEEDDHFGIWRTEKLGLETDYIKVSIYPYSYSKLVVIPVPKEVKEKVTTFLSSLIPIPKVLIGFTINFLQ